MNRALKYIHTWMNLKNGLSLRAQAQKTVSLGIPYSCVSRKQIWPIVTKSRAGVAGGWGGGAEQERNLGRWKWPHRCVNPSHCIRTHAPNGRLRFYVSYTSLRLTFEREQNFLKRE